MANLEDAEIFAIKVGGRAGASPAFDATPDHLRDILRLVVDPAMPPKMVLVVPTRQPYESREDWAQRFVRIDDLGGEVAEA